MTRKTTLRSSFDFTLTLMMTASLSLSVVACGADCEEDEKDALGQCPEDGEDGEEGGGAGEGAGEGGGDEGGGDEGGGAGFTKLYDDHLNKCAVCHAPGAGGFIAGTTEATLDFSSRDKAYSSITTGKASGLSGNVGGCNDVPFVGSSSGKSLIVAVLDEDVRAAYDNSSFPDCNGDSITDMSFRTNPGVPDSIVSGVKAWIDEGASND